MQIISYNLIQVFFLFVEGNLVQVLLGLNNSL